MKTIYKKKFLKELAKIPSTSRKSIEEFVFNDVAKAASPASMGKIEKMRGYNGYYKARFGDYRVGMLIEDNTVTFIRVLHRREIYRYFP